MGRRRRGGAGTWAGTALPGVLLGTLLTALVAAPVAPAHAAAPAAPPATAPAATERPLPACATAVAYSTGTATRPPVPLPAPASDAGGARLARRGLQVDLPPGTPAPPRLKASAWIVADLTTGDVLAACNAHVPLAPASTLKVLTALALHPRLDVHRRYVARPADAAIDGTKVGLSPGSRYTVDHLWHGLLLGSGNDTANALATLAGGRAAAARLMARTARSLGARDTVPVNTSGLDAPGQVSSVYDMAIFGRAALRDPAIARMVRTTTYRFPSAGTALNDGTRRTYQIQNHNRLLGGYRGTTGIKNGFTSTAGASLVASATRGGRSYVVAMLRSDVDVWGMGASLLDWAFAQGTRAEPVGRLDPTPAPAPGSSPGTTSAAAPPTGASAATPAPAAPGIVAAPVRATLETVPEESRTVWLFAALAVALAGGALVRRVASARSAGRRPTRPAARPRTPTAGRRPATKRAAAGTARRPPSRR